MANRALIWCARCCPIRASSSAWSTRASFASVCIAAVRRLSVSRTQYPAATLAAGLTVITRMICHALTT